MKKSDTKDLLRQIRSGIRLATPPPKRETPKNVYSRKSKHKRRFETPSFFYRIDYFSGTFSNKRTGRLGLPVLSLAVFKLFDS